MSNSILPYLHSLYERPIHNLPRDHKSLVMSQMGNHVCELYFSYHNLVPVEDTPARLSRIFTLGQKIEDLLVDIVGSGDHNIEQQVRLETLPYQGRTRLNGYIDVLLEKNSWKYVIEFKSMKHSKFEDFIENKFKNFINYYTQVQLYQYVGGYQTPGYLIAMDKDNCNIHIEEVICDKEYCEEIIQKAKYVIKMDHPMVDIKNEQYPRYCSRCNGHEICYSTRPF